MEESSPLPFEGDQEQLSQEECDRKPSTFTTKQRKRKQSANETGENSGAHSTEDDSSQVKDYLLHITDAMAALHSSKPTGLKEVKRKTGADVNIFPIAEQGLHFANINGNPSQIEKAIRFLTQTTENQGVIDAHDYWLRCVQEAFPCIDSRAYFLPPVYVRKLPTTTQSAAGSSVEVIDETPMKESDAKDQAGTERVFLCLQSFFEPKEAKMSEENREVLVGIRELHFRDYLGQYDSEAEVAAAEYLPRKDTQGEIDLLLIHKRYGFIICEVKSVDDNVKTIKIRLDKAVHQLTRASDILSKLVGDVAPGVRVTKTIAVPNLSSERLWDAIRGDERLTKALCVCLGAQESAEIPGLCLCSDQLSDPQTPWDVNDRVRHELGEWWGRVVAGKPPDSAMNPYVYKLITARFCGPATTVTVPCTSPPRLCVKTEGQGVSLTGELYTAQITLFPDQVEVINKKDQNVFLTGPPGTGKTVVLLLKGTEWLKSGHKVHILSTGEWSLAACYMLKHLLNSAKEKDVLPDQLQLLKYDFNDKQQVERAVNELTNQATGGSLYVIADEAGPDKSGIESRFKTFCGKLLKNVPNLHLWAASCYHRQAHMSWKLEDLTRSLRCPPSVIREVQQDRAMTEDGSVRQYSERGVPDHTDGPKVQRFSHKGHGRGRAVDCSTCGKCVADFLNQRLRVGVKDDDTTRQSTSHGASPLSLKWKDVLVLSREQLRDDTGIVRALKGAGVPVRVVENEHDLEKLATALRDVVWVVKGDHVRSLERKVVVCLELIDVFQGKKAKLSGYKRLHSFSRCTSQLVIVHNQGK